MRLSSAVILAVGLAGAAVAQTEPPRLPTVSYPTSSIGSALSIPSAPNTKRGQAQSTRNRDGHFYVRASINNAAVPMLVDTGSSGIMLRYEDAVSAGLNPDTMSFANPSGTANGTAYLARAILRTITVGGITRSNMPVLVAKSGATTVSLLGQTFFAQLGTFRISGDTLLLAE